VLTQHAQNCAYEVKPDVAGGVRLLLTVTVVADRLVTVGTGNMYHLSRRMNWVSLGSLVIPSICSKSSSKE
jgi:hypothetical protein